MTGKASLASVARVGHEFKRKRIETVDMVNCCTQYVIWWALTREIGRKHMGFAIKLRTIH